MGNQTQLNRISKRRDQILELQWPQMAEPPESLMKIPGFREYHVQQRLYHERLQSVLKNLVNNLGVADSTP